MFTSKDFSHHFIAKYSTDQIEGTIEQIHNGLDTIKLRETSKLDVKHHFLSIRLWHIDK